MHSFLICSATKKDRKNQVKGLIASLRKEKKRKITDPLLADPDTFLFKPKPSIGIDSVRELSLNLKLKPFKSKVKIAVFFSAEKMTPQAQHAFLKTLEEPSPNSILILETKNPYSLFPTIRSRCQLIQAKSISPSQITFQKDTLTLLKNLRQPSLGLRLNAVNAITDKKKAEILLKQLLTISRQKMKINFGWLPVVKLTHQALLDLEDNVNFRLVLEHLALQFPTQVE